MSLSARYAGAALTFHVGAKRIDCRSIRDQLGATACAAAVKADAYGLGATS